MSEPEPWLRGSLEGVPAVVAPLFFSFQQVREDLARFTEGLSHEQVWRDVHGGSVGFHLKHIAGSVDRLSTYLFGGEINAQQLEVLRKEKLADSSLSVLMQRLDESFRKLEDRLRAIGPEMLLDPRSVGRKKLPSTVLGLLVHIAEHTQRHLGQAITISKALRSSESG
jgi:uncharacterized damage-inducible protein DinB